MLNTEAKEKIARYAAGLVRDGETIYLDAGSTPLLMVKYLKDRKIKIVTTNLMIFQEMTGGYGLADFKCAMAAGFAYRSFDSTMPGLRYMSMRRGMTDIKYLARLKEVAGEVPEVKAFLADAPVAVVSRERHDKTTPDRMREEAARLLLKYSR